MTKTPRDKAYEALELAEAKLAKGFHTSVKDACSIASLWLKLAEHDRKNKAPEK